MQTKWGSANSVRDIKTPFKPQRFGIAHGFQLRHLLVENKDCPIQRLQVNGEKAIDLSAEDLDKYQSKLLKQIEQANSLQKCDFVPGRFKRNAVSAQTEPALKSTAIEAEVIKREIELLSIIEDVKRKKTIDKPFGDILERIKERNLDSFARTRIPRETIEKIKQLGVETRTRCLFYPNPLRINYQSIRNSKAKIPKLAHDGEFRIAGLRFLFIDCDLYKSKSGFPIEVLEKELFSKLQNLDSPPDVIVKSGGPGGYHLYWSFQYIPLSDYSTKDEINESPEVIRWNHVARVLQEYLDCSDAIGPAHSMRVPGTINFKPNERGPGLVEYAPGSRTLEESAHYPKYTLRSLSESIFRQFKVATNMKRPKKIKQLPEKFTEGWDKAFEALIRNTGVVSDRFNENDKIVFRRMWQFRFKKEFNFYDLKRELKGSGRNQVLKNSINKFSELRSGRRIFRLLKVRTPARFGIKKSTVTMYRLCKDFWKLTEAVRTSPKTRGRGISRSVLSGYYRKGEFSASAWNDVVHLNLLQVPKKKAVELLAAKLTRSLSQPDGCSNRKKELLRKIDKAYSGETKIYSNGD